MRRSSPCAVVSLAFLSLVLAGAARGSCGDDVLEVGEECDDGAGNGSNGCCSSGCTLVDADVDGICDLYDLCASPLIAAPKIVNVDNDSFGLGPLDTRKFTGRLTVPFPFSPPLDPALNGVRLLIVDADGAVLLDDTMPGGSQWRVNGSATSWSFERRTGFGALLTRARIKDLSRSKPGVVKISYKTFGATFQPAIPLVASVFLDPPDGAEGQCGQARPPCVVRKDGRQVSCR